MLTFHGLVLSVVEKVETIFFYVGFYQVWFREMSEKRANHRRGIVNNLAVDQNPMCGGRRRKANSVQF